MDPVMTTTNPLVSLPDMISCNILQYLHWYDVGRFDTALINRKTRHSYLFALKLIRVKVRPNEFWQKALDRGILRWLIRRNIQVISWDLKVNNAQLISIAIGFPLLQSLRINSINICDGNNITDEGIRALASGLPQLQSLDIGYRYCNITDEGIRALASGCHQLQSLNIGLCDKITDDGLRALARGCPQLQSLNTRGCRKITDEGVRALASGCPQLQSLDISYCGKITDDGIRALANGLPQLQSLDIGSCNKITDEGREIANSIK